MTKLSWLVTMIGSSALLWTTSALAQSPTPTPSRNLSDYVVFALRPNPSATLKSEKTSLGDDSFVAEGYVGANEPNGNGLASSVTLGKSVFMAKGSQVVTDQFVGPVSSSAPDSLYDLFANTCKNGCPPANVTIRDVEASAPVPLLTPSPLPTPVGSMAQSIDFQNCAQHTPLPLTIMVPRGSYTDTTVPGGCTLELTRTDPSPGVPTPSGADYEFSSLTVPSFAHVIVDKPATINIRGAGTNALTVGEWASIGPKAYINPNDIQINAGCGAPGSACSTITFNYSSHAGISLYAPYAQLHLQRSFRGKGRFVGNIVNGEQTLLLRAAHGTPAPTPSPYFFNTMTQEDYGSLGAPAELLPVSVGAPGIRSLTIQDSDALRCFLPAYGVPAALCAAAPKDDCVEAAPSPGQTPCPGQPTPPAALAPNMQICTSHCTGNIKSHNGQGGGTLTGQLIAAKLNVAGDPALGDLVIPPCLCTDLCKHSDATPSPGMTPAPGGCRLINNTTQQNQGGGGGLEDGITTVNDLIDFADQALSADCSRGGSCSETCGTAFAPPDPVRIGEMAWALQAINECFAGGHYLDTNNMTTTSCHGFQSDPPPTGCCSSGALCCSTDAADCTQDDVECLSITNSDTGGPCGACGQECNAPNLCDNTGHCVAP